MNLKEAWTKHKKDWSKCTACELCDTRTNVVLYKGMIPCDVLFIGEAPGQSEDKLGKPFIGPAGHLLNELIRNSDLDRYRLGFTNLVSCIPLGPDESGNMGKLQEPHKEHILACNKRLMEMIDIAHPRKTVAVGKLAAKWFPSYDATIIHPGSILRADITQRGLQCQQAVVRLRDLAEELET